MKKALNPEFKEARIIITEYYYGRFSARRIYETRSAYLERMPSDAYIETLYIWCSDHWVTNPHNTKYVNGGYINDAVLSARNDDSFSVRIEH